MDVKLTNNFKGSENGQLTTDNYSSNDRENFAHHDDNHLHQDNHLHPEQRFDIDEEIGAIQRRVLDACAAAMAELNNSLYSIEPRDQFHARITTPYQLIEETAKTEGVEPAKERGNQAIESINQWVSSEKERVAAYLAGLRVIAESLPATHQDAIRNQIKGFMEGRDPLNGKKRATKDVAIQRAFEKSFHKSLPESLVLAAREAVALLLSKTWPTGRQIQFWRLCGAYSAKFTGENGETMPVNRVLSVVDWVIERMEAAEVAAGKNVTKI